MVVPWWHHSRLVLVLGVAATLLGQLVRSKAMIDAGAAFTHEIAHEHVSSHRLIKTGLYAYLPDWEGGVHLYLLGI